MLALYLHTRLRMKIFLSKPGLGFCYRIWAIHALFFVCVLFVFCVQMLTRMCYIHFLHKVMLNWNESVYLWPESENSTKVIIILQRSTEKPDQKFCNDTGQRKQRVDIFWLCSHTWGLACPQCSWQQREHTALGAPGSAFSQHPALDGGARVFTGTPSPCHPTRLSHTHKSQWKHIHRLTNLYGLSVYLR